LIFYSVFFLACNSNQYGKRQTSKTLFTEVSPQKSGITFANQLHETDSMNALFYEYYYNGAGLAAGDLNNDGLSDLVFGANMAESKVYLNNGNLSFTDITEKCGVNTTGKWITGVSIVDINHDGWPDIYLCAAGNINYDYHNLLYISNGDGNNLQFAECAKEAGLDDKGYSTQAEFFDYDLDGDLDMYLVTAAMIVPNKNMIRMRKDDGSMINTDRLYRNEGIDRSTGIPFFRNVSREAGITWDGFGLGAAVCDINIDGWPDIYVGNDYISNDLLYVNQGNGTFREMIKEYTRHISYSTMGIDIADFNNDGLIDIFTLDMQPEEYYRKRIMAFNMREYKRFQKEIQAGYSPQYVRNMLQINNGNIDGRIKLSEIGQLAGTYETDWSWAPLFADFDNDGYKDLFIGNGITFDVTNMDVTELWLNTVRKNPAVPFPVLYKILRNELVKEGNIKKPNVMFHNTGGLTFDNITSEWGLDKPSYSTGSVFSDLDNDGDLDLILNNVNDKASVFENRLITGDSTLSRTHYIALTLIGDTLNTNGIGSKITVFTGKKLQYYEHFPIRGFQSMVDPKIHFGLGGDDLIDSVKIIWPDRKEQTISGIKADQVLKVDYRNASFRKKFQASHNEKLFVNITGRYGLRYKHSERQFIDFDIQPLIPHLYSMEGPGITAGDINSDGLDDFFVGGSTSYSGSIFIQDRKGNFTESVMPGNNNYEDMGALFFDADNDGDEDLYVVSGGSGLPPGNQFYADRLYINNGKGEFSMNKNSHPDERVCGSQVCAADYDRDGDLDLFVCGRIDLENYPVPPRCFLLRNNTRGGIVKFTDVTGMACPGLEKPGLVAAALWTDFNRDGWTDLILAGEWMPLTFFRNDKGKFTDITSSTGIGNNTGWWNSIAAADFDRDGDIDYTAGNLGLNTQYKVSTEEPMRIFAKDFDMNGTIDPVCSYYVQGKSYPIYHRNLLLSQIPSLRNKFPTYDSYARAGMNEIFPESVLKDAYIRSCSYFQSAWIENLGNGTFRIHALPDEAQISPVFGILTGDFNSDGNTDILLAGNSGSSNVYTGNYDASIGLLLSGNGKGDFEPVPGRKSGFIADGDVKAMAELTGADSNPLILIARNSDTLRVFRNKRTFNSIIRLESDDANADLSYQNGTKEFVEFYYGSGYLSRSSRVLRVPAGVNNVTFTGFSGKIRRVKIK